MTPELRHLYAALVLSWSEDTGHALYDELCPCRGQCVTTALVIADFLGGHIRQGRTGRGATHYWNVLPDGREIDWTCGQFDLKGDRVLRDGETFELTQSQALSRYQTGDKYWMLNAYVHRWLRVIVAAERGRG